jgi:hypothetical protein
MIFIHADFLSAFSTSKFSSVRIETFVVVEVLADVDDASLFWVLFMLSRRDSSSISLTSSSLWIWTECLVRDVPKRWLKMEF